MQIELMMITGMHCDGCSRNVTDALMAVEGVNAVKVSLGSGEASVQFDERRTTPERLKSAVRRAGYGVDGAEPTHSHHAEGGCCGGHADVAKAGGSTARHGQSKSGCCG